MKRRDLILSLMVGGLLTAACVQAQPRAEEVLRRSLAYHDPDGQWWTRTHRFTLRETRPGGSDRVTTFTIEPGGGFFYRSERDGHVVEARWDGTTCSATFDGSAEIPENVRTRYRLTCDGIRWWQAYYGFMHSLPMNLTSPGTRLNPVAADTTFLDRRVWALRVTYDEPVGTDTWYVYVDPVTYALVGCRFYHDEAKNDGEYIVFEGEVARAGFRIPETLRWYVNADGRFLGADKIVAYSVE
ncbi:MAG: hypothetical protein KatS3mg044_0579 [Rhodothermaceae bacterium]|nr:MAG: hypothetical protein KatS3mg044_0579 [Rhodothermaceae bacterium]